jgi:hypothetical protein
MVYGRSRPRIESSALDTDRSLRHLGRVVVERRDERDGSWTSLATFGSEAEAAERVDEELGLGHGEPADYRIRPIGTARWKRRLGWTVLVTLGGLCLVLLVLFSFSR